MVIPDRIDFDGRGTSATRFYDPECWNERSEILALMHLLNHEPIPKIGFAVILRCARKWHYFAAHVTHCHSCGSRNLWKKTWIPAFAGMTAGCLIYVRLR